MLRTILAKWGFPLDRLLGLTVACVFTHGLVASYYSCDAGMVGFEYSKSGGSPVRVDSRWVLATASWIIVSPDAIPVLVQNLEHVTTKTSGAMKISCAIQSPDRMESPGALTESGRDGVSGYPGKV